MIENRLAVVLVSVATVFLLVLMVVAVVSSDDELEGETWVMAALVINGSMTDALATPEVTMVFEDDAVRGFAGCNDYFGDYEVDGDSITFGPVGSTLAICEEDVSGQEFAFLGHLAAVDGYRIEGGGGRLILTQGSTDLVELESADE